MTTLFDFIISVNQTKKDLLKEDPQNLKQYNAFIINRGLSLFYDTVLIANEMNQRSYLDKDQQYRFLLNTVTKKKRFSKWFKKESIPEDIETIKKAYGYSTKRAEEVLDLLSDSQLNDLKQKQYIGGKS